MRRWLSRSDRPESISLCGRLFDKIYGAKLDYQSHIAELLAADDEYITPSAMCNTPDELKSLVASAKVALRARLRADAVVYARAQTHMGNSLIMFYPRGDRSSAAIPGSIEYIYSINSAFRFAVRRYTPPVLIEPDPFAQWADFPARTWSSQMSKTLETVQIDWVYSHFARYQLSSDQIVVLSLSQVKPSLLARSFRVC